MWKVGLHDSKELSVLQTQYQAATLIAIKNTRTSLKTLYELFTKAWKTEGEDRIKFMVDNDAAILDAIEVFRAAVRDELEVR